MRIAVTCQDFSTVTGHAGRSRRFIVFEGNGCNHDHHEHGDDCHCGSNE